MQAEKPDKPRNVLPDLIIPALALAFTGYYLSTITEVPWISQASAMTVSALLVASILAYLVRTAWRLRAGAEVLRLQGLGGSRLVLIRRVLLLVLTVAYVLLIEDLGFTLTTAAFVFLGILLLSSLSNWPRALAVSLGCSIFGYVVFIHFFKTRFPAGPIENLVKGLFQA